jgi:Transposase DDE domain
LAHTRLESYPVMGDVISDQRISLTNFYAKKDYPRPLRRVRIYDPEHKRFLVFLTNNFSLSAATIALLYKNRWKVELFFKWIKQHLRIKAFYGTSENAVCTQIWIAIDCRHQEKGIRRREISPRNSPKNQRQPF